MGLVWASSVARFWRVSEPKAVTVPDLLLAAPHTCEKPAVTDPEKTQTPISFFRPVSGVPQLNRISAKIRLFWGSLPDAPKSATSWPVSAGCKLQEPLRPPTSVTLCSQDGFDLRQVLG